MLRPFTSLRPLFRPAGILCGRHGVASSLELRNSFTTSVVANLKQLPPRPKHPPESDIEESFLKGSGPGGQKINRKIARDLLALKLDELANGAQSRAAIVGDTKRKRAASKAKKSRRKYRKLAGAEGEAQGEEGEEGEEGELEVELEGDVGEGQEQLQAESSVGVEEGIKQRENGEGEKREEGR
ncbi:hypothetical protein CHGG_07159 [Chaetomium globosum CBS 148.51]|uniref:Prokaryotic-type class I peptide chain release factors domain-containing protein n=1 Tax=Chaetomium globosum (strain ATCC 6205 / CBS 148.51 / DSM 1962 / NBRC 6347 / NRRL 1970) TaxID=306901 RepID=Q2GXZ5_CHAGB|nr:uncharacterized protein CHGG_07159 [Chaetomium globosum CBS 148.51]EAQ85906.1 hypothetical protein CHGG_07159 [Chaetomium globosum CBS 148.51]